MIRIAFVAALLSVAAPVAAEDLPSYNNEIRAKPFGGTIAVRAPSAYADVTAYAGEIVEVASLDLIPADAVDLGNSYYLAPDEGRIYRLLAKATRW